MTSEWPGPAGERAGDAPINPFAPPAPDRQPDRASSTVPPPPTAAFPEGTPPLPYSEYTPGSTPRVPPVYRAVPTYDATPFHGATPTYAAASTYETAPAYGAGPAYGTLPANGHYPHPDPAGPGRPPPGGWAMPPERSTDGLAIASLITSGAGLVTAGASGLVGIGLGIGALRRIRRTGAAGRGLAIAGIAVGAVMGLGFVAYVGFFIWAVAGSGGLLSSWANESADFTLAQDLEPGTCFERSPDGRDLSDGVEVSCSVPHATEILGPITFTGSPAEGFSVSSAADDAAWDECWQRSAAVVEAFDQTRRDEIWSWVAAPSAAQWAEGETTGYCLLEDDAGQLAGSFADGTAAQQGWST